MNAEKQKFLNAVLSTFLNVFEFARNHEKARKVLKIAYKCFFVQLALGLFGLGFFTGFPFHLSLDLGFFVSPT